MSETSGPSFLRSLQVLARTLLASLVIVLAAVAVALKNQAWDSSPLWKPLVMAGTAVAAAAVIQRFGYRARPIPPGTPAEEAAVSSALAFSRGTVLRFAIADLVAMIGVVVTFATGEGGLFPCVLGVVFAAVLILRHAVPNERVIAATQQALEADGGVSYLREALAAPPPVRPRRG